MQAESDMNAVADQYVPMEHAVHSLTLVLLSSRLNIPLPQRPSNRSNALDDVDPFQPPAVIMIPTESNDAALRYPLATLSVEVDHTVANELKTSTTLE